jgi:hypothetical protein
MEDFISKKKTHLILQRVFRHYKEELNEPITADGINISISLLKELPIAKVIPISNPLNKTTYISKQNFLQKLKDLAFTYQKEHEPSIANGIFIAQKYVENITSENVIPLPPE